MLRDGCSVGELNGDEITEEKILSVIAEGKKQEEQVWEE